MVTTSFINHFMAMYTPVLTSLKQFKTQYYRPLVIVVSVSITLLIYFKPQEFVDMWLTRDQQGYVFFMMGDYQQAASQFQNNNWQAFSWYRGEQFDQAGLLYNQFDDPASQLAYGNTMAHARRYVSARDVYQKIINEHSDHNQAVHNLEIVQGIIDDVNRLSESQNEEGASSSELGDEPQTGDGAKKQLQKTQLIEQYSAEQLLLSPALREMWLRQVKKNPSVFLANKFQAQYQHQRAGDHQ